LASSSLLAVRGLGLGVLGDAVGLLGALALRAVLGVGIELGLHRGLGVVEKLRGGLQLGAQTLALLLQIGLGAIGCLSCPRQFVERRFALFATGGNAPAPRRRAPVSGASSSTSTCTRASEPAAARRAAAAPIAELLLQGLGLRVELARAPCCWRVRSATCASACMPLIMGKIAPYQSVMAAPVVGMS
jgi:hypothetical protein